MSASSSATKTALRGYNNIYLIGSVQNPHKYNIIFITYLLLF